SKTEGGNEFLVVTIIPGNCYFGLEEKSYVFHQLLPLEKTGPVGLFHRVSDTVSYGEMGRS
ncbi:hypothetical protein MYX64_10440, partial [Nitrospinae bacterium AH_259_B05_G02_I21]|nr:hypothetical protein [Nitrospinae bacterium AH_259_B05_G02_I21]